MAESEAAHLRVLIANEELGHLPLLAEVVTGLGHEVIAREIDVAQVAEATTRELPDVALVGLGLSSEHALELIGQIVHEAACPVIALLSEKDSAYVREAAKRGIFAAVFHEDPDELRSAIEIALARFADYHNLQIAFGRRARIEQAKGILMSRNGMSADQAYGSLREYSGRSGSKLVDVATAVIESHGLLLPDTLPPKKPLDPV